jgi:hypothetical protein
MVYLGKHKNLNLRLITINKNRVQTLIKMTELVIITNKLKKNFKC